VYFSNNAIIRNTSERQLTQIERYRQGRRRRYSQGFGLPTFTPSTPQPWEEAVPGQPIGASNLNQFLGTHPTQWIYAGGLVLFAGYAYSVTAPKEYVNVTPLTLVPTNTGSAPQWIDQPVLLVANQTSINRISFPLCAFAGTASDVVIQLRPDNGGSPGAQVIQQVTVPKEFFQGIYTSSTNTTYTANTVTDTGATFPFYGAFNAASGFGGVPLIFGGVAIAGSDIASTGTTATSNVNTSALSTPTWANKTSGAAHTPASNTPYNVYPVVSIPFPVTGLTASITYHLVISGTTDTVNICGFPTVTSIASYVAQTGTSNNGPWTTLSKTLMFGISTYTEAVTGLASSPLMHTWEDGGVRWTGVDYPILANVYARYAPIIFREYNGTFRSQRLAALSGNGNHTGAVTSL
jgi:hypothetical protein